MNWSLASHAAAPSTGAIFVALLAILFMVLAAWEARRPLRLLRTRLVPALQEAWLRRAARRFVPCLTSRDLAEGALVRVVGIVAAPDRDHAGHVALSHLRTRGEFGETIEERTDGGDFPLLMSDGETVQVGALEAARTGRLRLLDGKSEGSRTVSLLYQRRQILVGHLAEVSGRIRRVIDERASSPHPRLPPTAWRLSAAENCPLIVQGAEQMTARSRLVPRPQPSGRILAVPAVGLSLLLLTMSVPASLGLSGVFTFLGDAGLSGLLFSLYLAVVGAPGTLRTWRRWCLFTGFLVAAVVGFWFGVRMR